MMRYLKHIRQIGSGWPQLGALLTLFMGLSTTPAAEEQGYLPGAVRNLQQVLKTDSKSPKDLEERRKRLEELTSPAALRNADLRAALGLDAWKDQDKVEGVAAIDDPIRRNLIDRFKKWETAILKQPDNLDAKLAAVTLLSEMSINVRSSGPKKASLAAELAPDLIQLLTAPEPVLRQAAARALGRVNPNAKVATEALGQMLNSGDTNDRRAAAEGLASMLRILLPLATSKSSSPTVEVERAEALTTGTLVAQTAGSGLAYDDPVVRQNCLDAIQQSAALLGELGEVLARDFPPSSRPPTTDEQAKIEQYRKDVEATMKEVQPLASAINAQAEGVAQSLSDPRYAEVRRKAGWTLAEIGYARQRLLRKDPATARPAAPGTEKGASAAPGTSRPNGSAVQRVALFVTAEQADNVGDDLLKPGLEKAIQPLILRLKDPDVRVRLAALEALVTMGRLAAPAIPAATETLRDPNHFVRWSAVRLLGKAGLPEDPKQTAAAVAGLIQRLYDPDLDVRKAAGTTLSIYGQAAAAAAKPLSQLIAQGNPDIRNYLLQWPPAYGFTHSAAEFSDAEMRAGGIRILQSMNRETASTAVPALTEALADPDARVRRAAAETLGYIGPLAKSALGALTKTLSDSEADVRRSASDAILAISE